MTRLLLALGSMLPSLAYAQTVEVELDSKAAKKMGLQPDEIEREINRYLSEELKLVDTDAYMKEMAEAAAFATKGMGVDYASNPRGFVFGLSAGVAAAGVSTDLFRQIPETLPPQGYAAQAAVMVGVNLGVLIPGEDTLLDRIVIYANGMYLRPPSELPIRGTLVNGGLHAQLRLLKPVRLAVLEWGGLAVTGGVEQSSYLLSLERELPLTQEVDGAQLRWEGVGTYEMSASSLSVPLEASTNLRVLFATVFGGAALDLASGRADAEAAITGDLYASAGKGKERDLGQATVTVRSSGVAAPMAGRVFGGIQLDIPIVKIYGQVNLATQNRFGGHVGVRVVL